jgi:hypothetical protein
LTGCSPPLCVAGGADPDDLVADIETELDDEDDAMRCGIQELSCGRNTKGNSLGGGISSTR